MLDNLINVGPDTYVEKNPYMLQNWGLVLTYEDEVNSKWHLLMPDVVREALARVGTSYIEIKIY